MSDVPSVDQIAYEEYQKFAQQMDCLVRLHPICQKCSKNNSVRISRWGPIIAMCESCLADELKKFEEYHRQSEEDANDSY